MHSGMGTVRIEDGVLGSETVREVNRSDLSERRWTVRLTRMVPSSRSMSFQRTKFTYAQTRIQTQQDPRGIHAGIADTVFLDTALFLRRKNTDFFFTGTYFHVQPWRGSDDFLLLRVFETAIYKHGGASCRFRPGAFFIFKISFSRNST